MAKEDIEAVKADLASANAMIAELTESVKTLEAENTEWRAKAAGNSTPDNVVEYEGVFYKTKAGSYQTEEGIVVLNKDLLESKQKTFGVERVRLASVEDIATLVKEESNLLEKI